MNKQKIPVTIGRKGRISQYEFDRLMREGAINLTNRKTSLYKVTWGTFLSVSTFIYLCMLLISQSIASEANYTSNTDIFVERMEEVIEQEETTQEDIDELIELLDDSVNSKEEDVNSSIFPTEEGDKEMREAFDKEVIKELPFDIDRLSYAVSMAETAHYTKGYGVTHNNGHGIKHGNTAPCPGVPKMYMCKFNTRLESHEAFKKIWTKWYGGFPTYAMADRWTGGDDTGDWLRIVNFYYQKGGVQGGK